MFRYICRCHLFASFASYSLPNIRTNSHTNTRFDAKQIHFLILVNIRFKKYVLKRIFAILWRISHSSEYSYTGLWIRIPLFVSAKKYTNTIFFLQQNSLKGYSELFDVGSSGSVSMLKQIRIYITR
jgi:hypothetical protein